MTIARKLTDNGQRRVLLKDLMSACAETYEAGDKRRNPTSGTATTSTSLRTDRPSLS